MSKRTPAMPFILATILIDIIGIGIVLPVVPTLILELGGESISETAKIGGLLALSYASMQFIFSPILGGLSDKYGRRPILLISLFALGIDYFIAALSPTLSWLFLARIVAGIGGASITTAMAYIADVSPPEKRAQNFGMIGAAFGVGFIIGPLTGGLLGEIGPRVPFFVAGGLALLNWLYGYFILPESLTPENRRPFSWKRANPIGSLAQLKKYPVIMGLVLSLVLIYIAAHAVQSNWSFFVIEEFQWSEAQIGYSLAFVGLMVALVQGLLIRVAVPKLGQRRAVYIGITFYALGLLLFAFANKSWMMYAFMIPYALGGLAGPTLQAIMSSQLPANEQGELQGGLTSLISVTSIVGPPLMTGIFAYFTTEGNFYFAGAAFLLGAILTFISVLFAYRTLRKTDLN
ncbi:TCR/Tet family MFS transporter [uncultured Roseivirga sp.]|mgnify:FL=1|uniref:TCR/Tet family MFS transporter n=1 Tax=uncultured Roseivirga sp. TaxID=543088 RepID=UPI0030D90E8F|tara:strand:+ start:148177 stop:149388 length:1212 start_codon:yes stop_codon:yes gene_type:complete